MSRFPYQIFIGFTSGVGYPTWLVNWMEHYKKSPEYVQLDAGLPRFKFCEDLGIHRDQLREYNLTITNENDERALSEFILRWS